jgi:hypothetical protein
MLERVAEWVLFSLMEEPISTKGTALSRAVDGMKAGRLQPLRYGFYKVFVRGLEHGKKRTSGAKALNGRGLYGTAEAVPFVKVRFMARLKPCPC